MDRSLILYCIGNAHLDPAWLWTWQEGFTEALATFDSALKRMEEFPDFEFTCAGAALYRFIERINPDMFKQIQRRVSEGRWHIVGGWHIQPDCNTPSGESFARHSLYSQRYYLDRFGVMATVGYNVDSFGHNAMLPQILRQSGMNRYVFMRPGQHEKILPSAFHWESDDGSRVLTYRIPHSYGMHFTDEADLEKRLERFVEDFRSELDKAMFFYGVGNHGGGPTIQNIQLLEKLAAKGTQVHLCSPMRYFDDVEAGNYNLPVIHDDLQHHAIGCYSAVSAIKAANRRCESALYAAEGYSVMAQRLTAFDYPLERFYTAWDNVLFNQFHDIMGGCSIRAACENALEMYGESLSVTAKIQHDALSRISWNIDTSYNQEGGASREGGLGFWESAAGTPLVVFNPHPWDVSVPVRIGKQAAAITDDTFAAQPIAHTKANTRAAFASADTVFIPTVPAMGYKVYNLHSKDTVPEGATMPQPAVAVTATDASMENAYVRVEFSADGGISGVYDKAANRHMLRGTGYAYAYDETGCDTWAHAQATLGTEVGCFRGQTAVYECNPLFATIKTVTKYADSALTQYYTLYHDRADIHVRGVLDMHEKHTVVKVSLPVNADGIKATYEIPFGVIKRDMNGHEEPAQRWVDVSSCDGYGVALINDSMYSYSVSDGDIRMTVARTPIYADHGGTRDADSEYTDIGIRRFNYIILPHAKVDNAAIIRRAAELNAPPACVIDTWHKGTLPLAYSGIRISADNVAVSALKQSEDGAGYVLRVYETDGRGVDAVISLDILDAAYELSLKPWEIATLYVDGNSKAVKRVNLIEL